MPYLGVDLAKDSMDVTLYSCQAKNGIMPVETGFLFIYV